MLTLVSSPIDTTCPPLNAGERTKLDWSGILSIDRIREHTKTDDIPGTTDEMLEFYRSVALEAAERYTGFLLAEQRVVSEPIEAPPYLRHRQHYGHHGYSYHPDHFDPYYGGSLFPRKPAYRVRLKYPVSDGLVYMYGGSHQNHANHPNTVLHVPINARTIDVPIRYGYLDLSNCCNPCSPHGANPGMLAMYKAGYSSAEDVPKGVAQGCLQYIAWVLQHPGDEILTVRNRRDARSEGAMGTNNIAIASGALDTWRILDADVI